MIESDMHLVQAPLYRVKNKGWHCDYTEALQFCGNELNWDPAAIMGIISFCYTSGNRTLLTEIERKPWLSELNGDSDPILKKIPKGSESVGVLNQLATLNASSSQRQLAIVFLQHSIIKQWKDTYFWSLYLSFHAYLEMSDVVMPVIADRINTLVKIMDIVKKQRNDEINVPEQIEKELQEWLKEREAMKKAFKQYGV